MASSHVHAALALAYMLPAFMLCLLLSRSLHAVHAHIRDLRAACSPCLHPRAGHLTRGHACHPSMHVILLGRPACILVPWSASCLSAARLRPARCGGGPTGYMLEGSKLAERIWICDP
jgi:hypothetical protein